MYLVQLPGTWSLAAETPPGQGMASPEGVPLRMPLLAAGEHPAFALPLPLGTDHVKLNSRLQKTERFQDRGRTGHD